jgi:predicted nucleotidyltransferase
MKKENIIFKSIFGSKLYGTDTEESDDDYKGIFLIDIKDLILNNFKKSIQYSNKEIMTDKSKSGIEEVEYYSLHYFINLACEGQTSALDLLFSSPRHWIISSSIWDYLYRNRKRFITKKINSFAGYAMHQAAKYSIKGSNLNLAERILKFLKEKNDDSKLIEYLIEFKETFKEFSENSNQIYYIEDNDDKSKRYVNVLGKGLGYHTQLKYIKEIMEQYINKFGNRAKLAAENKGIDWKAVSHAARAIYQVRSLINDGEFEYPLKETKYIMDIKMGKVTFSEVIPYLEELIDDTKKLIKNSSLPDFIDPHEFDEFILDVYKIN